MYRLNIGGKFLTNYLKEVVSYRQYNMMDETYLINKVKELTCYVSQDFSASLENIKYKPKGPSGSGSVSGSVSGIREGEVRYVLPDYSHSKEGYVLKEGQTIKEDQQVLVLGNERFAIPELLFTPSDVGISPRNLFPLSRLLGVQTGVYFWDELVIADFCRIKTGRTCRGSGASGERCTGRTQIVVICEYHPCRRKFQHPRISRETVLPLPTLYFPQAMTHYTPRSSDLQSREREVRSLAPSNYLVRFMTPSKYPP